MVQQTPTKQDFAEQFVRSNGFDPRSEAGAKRVSAILAAAEVCESYAQFTRAAQYAVTEEFGTVAYDKDLVPAANRFLALTTVVGAFAFASSCNMLASLAESGWFRLFHDSARTITG